MRWFDASPRRATPKGQTFIPCTAPHQQALTYLTGAPLRARGALKIAMIRLMATRLAGHNVTWANATEREAHRRLTIETQLAA